MSDRTDKRLESYQTAVIRRLDTLIMLLLEKSEGAEKASTTERIRRLREFGMTPSEISGIVGKGANYVSAVLSRASGRKGAR